MLQCTRLLAGDIIMWGDYMTVSAAHGRASNKYNASHYDRISLQVLKGERDRLKAVAAVQGKSLNKYITDAIDAAENGIITCDKCRKHNTCMCLTAKYVCQKGRSLYITPREMKYCNAAERQQSADVSNESEKAT